MNRTPYRHVQEFAMQQPPAPHPAAEPDYTHGHGPDMLESIVPSIPLVLPIVGGILIFLLAFIAVTMG